MSFSQAKIAAIALRQLTTSADGAARIDWVLRQLAAQITAQSGAILSANAQDVAAARAAGLAEAFIERLTLTSARLAAAAQGIEKIAALPAVVGEVEAEFVGAGGIKIAKIREPLGVIGVIFESRPNVVLDAFALCFKAGNAVVLKGGKEAAASNRALVGVIAEVLARCALPAGCVMLAEGEDAALQMCGAVGQIDCLIARGGAGLIGFVGRNARVPFLETGVGNCSVFVEKSADLAVALRVADNAKTSRPSVCNAAENLLIDEAVAAEFLPQLARLWAGRVQVFGCEKTAQVLARAGVRLNLGGAAAGGANSNLGGAGVSNSNLGGAAGGESRAAGANGADFSKESLADEIRANSPALDFAPAGEAEFGREFLACQIAVKVVSGLDEALAFIEKYGSRHSECIVTQDAAAAARFLREVDAAAVYHNASTRFTDGECFGFGGEIGISTQKLHARGPMGLRELTTYKYVVRGEGQIRI